MAAFHKTWIRLRNNCIIIHCNPFCQDGRGLLQEIKALEPGPSTVWQGSDSPPQSFHEGLPSFLAGDGQRKRRASSNGEEAGVLSKRSKASKDPTEGTSPAMEKAESGLGKVKGYG